MIDIDKIKTDTDIIEVEFNCVDCGYYDNYVNKDLIDTTDEFFFHFDISNNTNISCPQCNSKNIEIDGTLKVDVRLEDE